MKHLSEKKTIERCIEESLANTDCSMIAARVENIWDINQTGNVGGTIVQTSQASHMTNWTSIYINLQNPTDKH